MGGGLGLRSRCEPRPHRIHSAAHRVDDRLGDLLVHKLDGPLHCVGDRLGNLLVHEIDHLVATDVLIEQIYSGLASLPTKPITCDTTQSSANESADGHAWRSTEWRADQRTQLGASQHAADLAC